MVQRQRGGLGHQEDKARVTVDVLLSELVEIASFFSPFLACEITAGIPCNILTCVHFCQAGVDLD